MISHQKTSSIKRRTISRAIGFAATSSLLLASPLMASDYSFSGESQTMLRMKTTIDKKKQYPVYEYIRLTMLDNRSDGSGVSFNLGAWGRADLADKTSEQYTDGDLQNAYLSYRAAKNNTVINIGRQFVTEGVATERIDGLYLRSDFAAGIGASAFAGKSVIEESNYKGGNIIYGTRLSHTLAGYYSIGASILKSEAENKSRYREEVGVDLWAHPFKQLDLSGRSSYNNLTEGWMEHSYALALNPLDQLHILVDVSNINYQDYFFNMTTSALNFSNRLIDRNEKMTSLGGAVSYTPLKNLVFSGDYKHYNYEIAKEAEYFGGKATYSLPESFSIGCSVHRMQGQVDRLRYTEYRAFASKKIEHFDLSLDAINIEYDARLNGIRNSYAVTGSAGYEFNEKLKIGTDLEYSQSPDFDNEVRGLVKVTYSFDTKRVEKGGKHEK